MNDEKRDTFPDLIADMRGEEPDMPPEYHAYASEQLNGFADRLEALLAGMEPFLMPVYGQALAGGAIEKDPPPILEHMLAQHDVPPGSDWVVVDPIISSGPVDVVASREEYDARRADGAPTVGEFVARETDDDPVTGDG